MQFSSKVVPAGFDLLACKDLSDSNELMDVIYEFVLTIATPGGTPYKGRYDEALPERVVFQAGGI